MHAAHTKLTFEVEIVAGEEPHLPTELLDSIGPGNWLITVEPARPSPSDRVVRRHAAFLNGYAPEDEGLYDDYPSR